MDERAFALLDEISRKYREILGGKLTGVYVHGSLAFGCFQWAVSDIDFLAVVREKLSDEEQVGLIHVLLNRTSRAPDKGFEMSVVLEEDLLPFVYPTPFELHFSNAYLEDCRQDVRSYCMRPHGADPDLAAHCTVTRAVGLKIWGEEIRKVFGEVPREAYLDSILKDVECAEEDVLENPVYVILNLCRVLAAVREGKVLSKAGGGRWGIAHIDACWHGVIREALAAYEYGGKDVLDEAECAAFASAMLGEIRRGMRN